MSFCKSCHAKRFEHEPKGFCCFNGETSLVTNDASKQLYELFTFNSEEAIEFQKYIRTYNNIFAFTSFGVKYDKNLSRRNKGIYTFRDHSQAYHYC